MGVGKKACLAPWKRLTAVVLAWLCFAAGAWAEDVKDRLVEAGLTPLAVYDGNVAANLSGGVHRGESYSGILHMQLAADGKRIADLPGVSGWLDVLWVNGGQPSKYVGDVQNVSNIAAPPALRLYEAWLQYNSSTVPFSVLAGRYDLSTEFYQLASASLFLNSSFGTGPELGQSGFGGASVFPNTSVGVRLAYNPAPNVELRAAILNGARLDRVGASPAAFGGHDGIFLIAEAALLNRGSPAETAADPRPLIGRSIKPRPYDDKVAVGAWYYTAGFGDFSTVGVNGAPVRQQGQAGAYLTADHLLVQMQERRISGFVQFGIADQVVNRYGAYAGVGLTGTGLFADRPDDQLGIAAAVARSSLHYIRGQQQNGLLVNGAETAIELSYLAQVTPWLGLQPDVQYVIHPNTDPRVANALVAQFRFILTF